MTTVEALSRFSPIEIERKQSIGTILAIVGIDPSRNGENASNPRLWTTIEEKPKPATDRIKGQISFPADTRKVGENKIDNTIGCLAEFSDDDRLIREGLFLMPSSFIERTVPVKGNPVDLVVVVFDGFLANPIVPFDKNEVSANGWMSREDLKKEDPLRLRSFVREVITMEETDGPISNLVTDYFKFQQARIPLSVILPPSFSISSFYNQRERLPDVIR